MRTKKIFIDCGFHHGEGLRQFIEMLGIDQDWLVIAFEPNPACEIGRRVRELKELLPFNLSICYFDSAVYTKWGKIQFSQEDHVESMSGSPRDGRSNIDGWASQVSELKGAWQGLQDPIDVKAIDFSEFLESLPSPFDSAIYGSPVIYGSPEIYCKMDIEGSEFPVLRKLLADGNAKLIKALWVEFHHRFIPGESYHTVAELIKQLSEHTTVRQWH